MLRFSTPLLDAIDEVRRADGESRSVVVRRLIRLGIAALKQGAREAASR